MVTSLANRFAPPFPFESCNLKEGDKTEAKEQEYPIGYVCKHRQAGRQLYIAGPRSRDQKDVAQGGIWQQYLALGDGFSTGRKVATIGWCSVARVWATTFQNYVNKLKIILVSAILIVIFPTQNMEDEPWVQITSVAPL